MSCCRPFTLCYLSPVKRVWEVSFFAIFLWSLINALEMGWPQNQHFGSQSLLLCLSEATVLPCQWTSECSASSRISIGLVLVTSLAFLFRQSSTHLKQLCLGVVLNEFSCFCQLGLLLGFHNFSVSCKLFIWHDFLLCPLVSILSNSCSSSRFIFKLWEESCSGSLSQSFVKIIPSWCIFESAEFVDCNFLSASVCPPSPIFQWSICTIIPLHHQRAHCELSLQWCVLCSLCWFSLRQESVKWPTLLTKGALGLN